MIDYDATDTDIQIMQGAVLERSRELKILSYVEGETK